MEGATAGKAPFAAALTPASTRSVEGFQIERKPDSTRTPALVSSVA